MTTNHTIFQRINAHRAEFSVKQRKLADYIINHYQTAAFLNSTDLAHAAGVSGSTVIRFAEALEYDGFPKMKEALHYIVQQDINTVDAFMNSSERKTVAEHTVSNSLFQPCIDTFHTIERSLPPKLLDDAAQLLSEASQLYIVGFQGASFLAEYTSYFLSKIRKDVHRINVLDSNLFENLHSSTPENNAALIYAFPRFPVMTQKLAAYFHEQHVPMVCMSTTTSNQISVLADIVIPIDIEYRAYIDHLAPVVYISELLSKKISNLNEKESVRQLEAFETYAETTHLFCKKITT